MLNSDTLALRRRRKCLGALRKLCGRHALLPRSVQITPTYDRSNDPQYRGGYAEVWKGKYQGRKVAVKVLIVYVSSDLDEIMKVIMSRACVNGGADHNCVGILQGSHNVEKSRPFKRAPVVRSDNE